MPIIQVFYILSPQRFDPMLHGNEFSTKNFSIVACFCFFDTYTMIAVETVVIMAMATAATVAVAAATWQCGSHGSSDSSANSSRGGGHANEKNLVSLK
jgi:hypothetical protein